MYTCVCLSTHVLNKDWPKYFDLISNKFSSQKKFNSVIFVQTLKLVLMGVWTALPSLIEKEECNQSIFSWPHSKLEAIITFGPQGVLVLTEGWGFLELHLHNTNVLHDH